MTTSTVAVLPDRDKPFLTLNSNNKQQTKLNSTNKRTVTFKPITAPIKANHLSNVKHGAASTIDTSKTNTTTVTTTTANILPPVDSDIFSTKHANSLIDIKKAYYEVFSNDTEKSIFISYDFNSNIQERKFIVDLVRQLKENYLNDDVWFDKDELVIGKPIWTVSRLEAAEHSNAAILVVTPNYFENQMSIYESKALYDHKCTNDTFYLAIIVLYIKGYPRLNNASSSMFNDTERIRARKIVQNFALLQPLIDKSNVFINLSDPKFMPLSLAEKVSYCIGLLSNDLEKYAKLKRPAPPMTPFDESDNHILHSAQETIMENTPFNISLAATSLSVYSLHTTVYGKHNQSVVDSILNKNYLYKTLTSFKPNDVQQFLEDLGIDEYYRSNFAEYQVDGYLLSVICDEDLTYIFDIDNKLTRKKLRNAVTDILQKEQQVSESWHLQLKYLKPAKANSVYLIFDPQDHPTIIAFMNELKASNIDVIHHQGFGSSKEEFMKMNATAMAQCKFVLIYLTENSANSTFVFHECTYSQLVLNKPKIITIMVKNVWKMMRHTLKAILGDHLALDFTGPSLKLNMRPLLQFFKPRLNILEPMVRLERTNSDENTLKSLDLLSNTSSNPYPLLDKIKVFISQITDHWEAQRRLEQLLSALETFNIKCWFDLFSIENQRLKNPLTRSLNHFDEYKYLQQVSISSSTNSKDNNLNIRTAQVLICCITPKYLTSDICIKDINLADTLHIPIIPIMLKSCIWPPDNVQFQIRRVLASLKCIDISNDALLKRNLPQIINAIHHAATKYSKQLAKQSTTSSNHFNDQSTNSEHSFRSSLGTFSKYKK